MPHKFPNGLGVDLDRGVQMSSHSKLGIDVYMYLDDPGVYYTAHGEKIDAKIAQETGGFDTVDLERKRKIKAALHDANEEVLAKFSETKGPQLVEDKNGFTIMDYGMGRYKVFSPEDKVTALHKTFLPLEQAKVLLEHLSTEPKPEVSAPKVTPGPSKKPLNLSPGTEPA